MKRLLFVLLLFLSVNAFSQARLGIKVSPSFVFNRIKIDSDSVNVTKNGAGFRPSFGLVVDLPMSENYYFSTGISYMSKTEKFNVDPANGSPVENKYIVQYIQLPLTIKMFTNEIAIDKRLYFQTGANLELQVYNEEKLDNSPAIDSFRFLDIPLHFGAGAEIYMGTRTIIFFGVHYQRGLINVVKDENFSNSVFSVKNDIFGVDVGVKF